MQMFSPNRKILMVTSLAGLGNILLPFISGIIFSEETGRKMIVNKSKTAHGDLLVSDLFHLEDRDIDEVGFSDLRQFLSDKGVTEIHYYIPRGKDIGSSDWTCLGKYFKDELGIDLPITYFEDDNLILSDDHNFILSYTMGNLMSAVTPLDMSYDTGRPINRQNFKKAYHSLRIREELKSVIDDFVHRNNIDSNTLGIHFRLTDVKETSSYRGVIDRVKGLVRQISCNSRIRFFICSDEADVEKEFVSEFGEKMIAHSKNHYPEYNGDKSNEETVGQNFSQMFAMKVFDGVRRDKETMMEAFADLMILSSTTMARELSNGVGTFNTLAKTLSRDVRYLTGDIRNLLPSLAVVGSPYPETGHCFLMGLPEYTLVADTADEPTRSRLVLYEDDRSLGPAHSLHEDIRHLGGGRYSHWHGNLYFSSSDHSDPRTNGREYKIVLCD